VKPSAEAETGKRERKLTELHLRKKKNEIVSDAAAQKEGKTVRQRKKS